MLPSKKIILIFIVILAVVLRIYKISKIPPSLSWDEVSIGNNAYSIIKTGKDEHGRFLPVDTFVAYGDYKPPIPIYLTVPFIHIFGLNEFSVRLPVALAGAISILFTYLLVLEVFDRKKEKESVALLSATILAVSPWHINLSRAGFEATIALMWIIMGAYFVLHARKFPRFYLFAFIPFILAVYTFNSARYAAPIIGLLVFIYSFSYVKNNIRYVSVGLVMSLLLLAPIVPHLFSKEAKLRYQEVNIFSDPSVVELSNSRIQNSGNAWWARIVNNRRVGYGLSFVKHYLDHFEPSFLFIHGDGNPKFSTQDVGQLYIIELPFILLGWLYLVTKDKKNGILLTMWLGVAIVPASVARETPHALRILNSFPVWHIFIASGILYIKDFISKKRVKKMFNLAIFAFYLINIMYYLNTYYVHYPVEYSGEWQFGYKDAILYAESVKGNYSSVVISDYIGRPYAYALFYSLFSPERFLQTKRSYFDASGFYHVDGFEKYEFISKNPQEFTPGVLYIVHPDSVPQNATVKKRFDRLNKTTALVAFEI